ncbi:MAG: cysteine--tRNA ligase [Ignavibacteriae bacterium]|nr:cysteine--tRNA ligase [Ignavibacteriota bacterium]
MEKLILYNTLTRRKEEFRTIEPGIVKMYCCGPTVYNFAHIGNLRAYFFEDILKRVLLYNGYNVKHVMNITDVGHLVSDDDEGEDKMEKGSAREGKTVWEIANFYTEAFKKDISLLNIIPPTIYCKATDNIKEQIDMIKCLEAKGYTYTTADGVYYDTSKFPEYGKLAMLDIEGLEEGKRIQFSDEKKNKTDFALWKFSPKDEKRQMEWESPWGVGFPGWHIECSAMSQKYLGETFDIHCGGVDHIPIHHTNEIAQAEACSGKQFVNYWLHGEFLIEDKGKMSKSSGEFLRLQTLIDKGYSPLDYRYFLLMTHYRKKIKFSFDNLDAARNGFNNLKSKIAEIKSLVKDSDSVDVARTGKYLERFSECINDDLNAGEGLALLWELLKNETLNYAEKILLVSVFDNIFGLDLEKVEAVKTNADVPAEIIDLAEKRIEAKKSKNFKLADELRDLIKQKGYEVVDEKGGAYSLKQL